MADGQIVGWFHGRTEYGPRALGARSILADPRDPRMQSDLNLKIKFRESFRPFAPCVLREHVHEWFQMRPGEDSPYMLQVVPVLEGRRLPLTAEQQDALRHDPDLAAASTSSEAPSRRSPTLTSVPASRRFTSGTAGSTDS